MKSFKIKVLVLALLIGIGFFAGWYVRAQRFKTSFTRIQVGDTKEQVISQLGQPGETSPCFHPSEESELQRKCADEFWYYSFLERWGISFDKDGKVIHKTFNVSY
jgi:hypothetical protein